MGNQQSSVTSLVVAGTTTAIVLGGTAAVLLLRRISQSVGLAKPTLQMLKEEEPSKHCALFRKFPSLSQKLAWRSLQAISASPIHVGRCKSNDDLDLHFFVKREDLISTKIYGGNKVRTLQHQLAVCESHLQAGNPAYSQLVTVGTGGSNQVVATVLYGQLLGWNNTEEKTVKNAADNSIPTDTRCKIHVCWMDKDEPDLDNTLNMLSVFSFSQQLGFLYNWGQQKKQILCAIYHAWRQSKYIPMMMGGNCTAGVLGQVSGMLELAEQIREEKCPSDIERIYVPVGSSCTISGLIVGAVLVRECFPDTTFPDKFKIVGCNVHPHLALLDRWIGFHTNSLWNFLPLTISHSVKMACRALQQLAAPEDNVPSNLEHLCQDFIRHNVELRAEASVVGPYGGHSPATRRAAHCYDKTGSIREYAGNQQQQKEETPLWVCGHFVAKALQPLLADLQEDLPTTNGKKYMLWMTKSAIQPRSEQTNEWDMLLGENATIQKWANDGKAESTLRPGKLSTANGGTSEDYRTLMTQVNLSLESKKG
mmetsp:Transcript_7317/g.11132  ORF Transcript_7317/g.11132 Transcript_7317/m.11132 type:complete len:536 (+) Transcript_7317:151-1758(+)